MGLLPAPGSRERRLGRQPDGHVASAFGGARNLKRLRLDRMRGPSEAAKRAREDFEAKVEQALDEDPGLEHAGKWGGLAEVLRGAAEETVGRQQGRKAECPALEQLHVARRENAEARRLAWEAVRLSQGTPAEEEATAAHKALRRRHRREMRRQKEDIVRAVCKDLERAAADDDTGAFYRGLRQLGCWLNDARPTTTAEFTPEDGRRHFLSVGGAPAEMQPGVLDAVPAEVWRDALPED
eukprot:4277236-Heterocapsa_arctica.AAC.1